MRVELVNSAPKAAEACKVLLRESVVGFDSEGASLSRFGKLGIVQFRSPQQIFVCDALVPETVNALRGVLECERIVKVVHDCREDASALFHQHKIELRNVYDTQIAHQVSTGQDHVSSLQQVRKEIRGERIANMATSPADSQSWIRRPLGRLEIEYAVDDVVDSLFLYSHFQRLIVCPAKQTEMETQLRRYLDYRMLNRHINMKGIRPGMRLQAMLAATAGNGWYFKLNCGVPGIVSGLERLARIHKLRIGETVDCTVLGWTLTKDAVLLDPL